jgi:hypothetical protein
VSEKSEFIKQSAEKLEDLFLDSLNREETAELMFEVMKHQVSLVMLLPDPKAALTTFTNGMHEMLDSIIESEKSGGFEA